MRDTSLLGRLLPFPRLSVQSIRFDDGDAVVSASLKGVSRCSDCGKKAPRYDRQNASRWRHLNFCAHKLFIEIERWRVDCADCGIVGEELTWCEGGGRFTSAFEDQVTWLVQHCDKTTVSTLLNISWRTVGRIISRATGRHRSPTDWSQVRAIGVDELSYRKGHRYLTLVSDLDTGVILWGKEGRSAEVLNTFFDEIGEDVRKKIEIVAIDMCAAFEKSIKANLSGAAIVYDRFHVQRLVSDALDEARREEWRNQKGKPGAQAIKNTRYALLKSPWNLTLKQSESLSRLQVQNKRLFRAYLLKESFVEIYRRALTPDQAREDLKDWLAWACRSQIATFVKAAKTIKKRLDGILRYFESGYSNGPAEGLNNKARLATRQAYGFHSADAVLAMINLRCTGLVIPLPWV